MTGVVKLLTNAGAASGVDITGEWKTWYGGPGDLWLWGDFGGGAIHLEGTPNEGGFVSCITGTQTIVPGVIKFNLNHGAKIRAVLDGTTASSSGVFAEVF